MHSKLDVISSTIAISATFCRLINICQLRPIQDSWASLSAVIALLLVTVIITAAMFGIEEYLPRPPRRDNTARKAEWTTRPTALRIANHIQQRKSIPLIIFASIDHYAVTLDWLTRPQQRSIRPRSLRTHIPIPLLRNSSHGSSHQLPSDHSKFPTAEIIAQAQKPERSDTATGPLKRDDSLTGSTSGTPLTTKIFQKLQKHQQGIPEHRPRRTRHQLQPQTATH